MFERLVVSSTNRGKGKIGRYFFGTSLLYLAALGAALALSIWTAAPRLADSSDGARVTRLAVPPQLGSPERAPSAPSAPDRAAPNLSNLAPLERILDIAPGLQPSRFEPIGPPAVGPVGDPGGVPGGAGQMPAPNLDRGFGTGPSSIASAPEPPPPVEVRRPDTRPREPERVNPVRVASVVLQGKATNRRVPAYPAMAKKIGLQGPVVVEIVVSPEGRVESARAISGHALLVKAAVDAVYDWQFQPTTLNGRAVRVTGVVTFNFKLDN